MRSIGVVTVARSDYGIYKSLLDAIQASPDLELSLYVSGMHLSPDFGLTVEAIESDGYPIAARVEMLLSSDTAEGISKSIGVGVMGFAQCFASRSPDILVVLGDRFEMFAAAVAALPFTIPIVHIHGGERTEGQIDEAIRHAITKMAHLHFVAAEEYAHRVVQMGEQPWRVVVSGAPSLDNLRTMEIPGREELERLLGIDLQERFLLVTYHPVTLQPHAVESQLGELLGALDEAQVPCLFTYSNADVAGRRIIREIQKFASSRSDARVIANAGLRGYYGLMSAAAAMVGNSSSGLIEAASFRLPVVNVGDRQRGRIRPPNVLTVGNARDEIVSGIRRALSEEFRQSLANLENPYGDGTAATTISDVLANVEIDNRLIMKEFHDIPSW